MQVQYIKVHQDGIIMYLLKLGVEELINNSIIERYSSGNDTGYQRQPIAGHYKKISKYFMESNRAILPTAILAAISPDKINETDDHLLDINDKIRIVDGQHRIKGIEELKKGYTSSSFERFVALSETYEFPIILLVVPADDTTGVSVLEVDAFININNKGKRVNTNLAKELSEQSHRRTYIIDSQTVQFDDELVTTSATRIVKKLADKVGSMWYDNVILGDAIDNKKPISINAFSKAIKPLVHQLLSTSQTNGKIETSVLYEKEESILEFINQAWITVMDKWPECFSKDKKYNSSYNISKAIGVFPLYGLLAECHETVDADFKVTLNRFMTCLVHSSVVSSDWLVGGKFTGMSSGQAIKQIIKIIKNEN